MHPCLLRRTRALLSQRRWVYYGIILRSLWHYMTSFKWPLVLLCEESKEKYYLSCFPSVDMPLHLFSLNLILQYLNLLYEVPTYWELHKVVRSNIYEPTSNLAFAVLTISTLGSLSGLAPGFPVLQFFFFDIGITTYSKLMGVLWKINARKVVNSWNMVLRRQ